MRKVALFDLDGTLWKSGVAIESAVRATNTLKEKGVEVYYVTNNSTATILEFVDRIQAIGIACTAHDVLNTGVATGLYCQKEGIKSAYILGEDGLIETLGQHEVHFQEENPDAVIVGLKRNATYAELATAMKYILSGARFIATNTDAQFPAHDGLIPGAGSLVSFVTTASKTDPVVIGKPNKAIFDAAFMRYEFAEDDLVVMIGDNYDTDILGGIEYGLQTIHVEGGIHTTSFVQMKEKQPTISVPTLEDERVFALFGIDI